MIYQEIDLNLIPGGVLPRVNVSQYDYGSRTIQCNIYEGSLEYSIPSGATITVQGTKADMTGFQYECTFSGSTVNFILQQQMTIFPGDVTVELVIAQGDTLLGTANFIICVERCALDDDTAISETDLPLIQEALASLPQVISAKDTAVAAASTATGAATTATNAKNTATTAATTATNAASTATNASTTATTAASTATSAATRANGYANSAQADATLADGYKDAAAASAAAALASESDAESAATTATNAKNAITNMYTDINEKLDIATFEVRDDGNLYYDGGAYTFAVDNNGNLTWEVSA